MLNLSFNEDELSRLHDEKTEVCKQFAHKAK